MERWPWQTQAKEWTRDALNRGVRRLLIQSPTGMGKTLTMKDLILEWLGAGEPVSLYTNRQAMIEQLSAEMGDVAHGIRSDGYAEEHHHDFQISSIQTEHSKVVKREKWKLHRSKRVLVDEAHLHNNAMGHAIFNRHLEAGATIHGFTATPFGLEGCYDELMISGTASQGRQHGALVPAVHYGCDEPDLRAFKKLQSSIMNGGEVTLAQARKAMMAPGIMGRVWRWFNEINPDHRPTILFAPGVEESLWFAEKFVEHGVSAAHIDGEHVWLNGELHPATSARRKEVFDGSESGAITVICNRFVMREGVNCPWLSHGIFATLFGSLSSYLQAGGRLLRSHPSLAHVTIQDHGGHWWRPGFGSLNVDRHWELEWTTDIACGLAADQMRSKQKEEPFRCPECGRVWTMGRVCRRDRGGCGYELPAKEKRSRPVVSTNGELRVMVGDIYQPRRVSTHRLGPDKWKRMYWRSRTEKGARTFTAAEALFASENYWHWPDRNWPFMPLEERDFYRLVADVPMERLRA